jgi:hypothetical protein
MLFLSAFPHHEKHLAKSSPNSFDAIYGSIPIQTAHRSFLVRMIVIIIFAAGSGGVAFAQSTGGTNGAPAVPPAVTVAFQGAVPFGLVNTAVQAPGEASGGFNSIDSGWGARLTLEYADLTAPAVFPVINDLFKLGWTWDNSGGNNIMGAYRFGVAIGMPL